MTLLCLDCGNTRLKWGLRDGGRWLAQEALPLSAIAGFVPPRAPARIIACNVAGAAAGEAVEALAHRTGAAMTWARSQPDQCGVSNRYDNPAQLGADRWAALVGAWALHGNACLVVNAGTATTIDVLDAAGVFQGGLILPGVTLMREALAARTAGLPLAAGAWRELPRNTDDAIASGCLAATLGAIERTFARVADAADARCLLAGGNAPALEPLLGVPVRRFDYLVLEGLARIAQSGQETP